VTAVEAGPTAGAARPRLRVGVRTAFFALLVVVLACYLQLAMGMEWRTAAGRIGPGFFPRVIGVLGVVLALAALVRSLRAHATVEVDPTAAARDEAFDEETGEADLGRHPRTTAIVVGASAAFAAAFVVLGAIIACAVFLFGCLWLLNRPRPVLNTAISLGLALGLYLLFETLLDAGLPAGVLPLS
jgi:putative tricarboxylic transport membrane protein